MTGLFCDIIRAHCRPLKPRPTGEPAVLRKLAFIRAALFDVYGTMFISASGDVGTVIEDARQEAFAGAFREAGCGSPRDADQGVDQLLETIHTHHARSRQQGIDYPEVDIVEVWRDTVAELRKAGWDIPPDHLVDFRRLAIQYEVRANPVWPMPQLYQCLADLRSADIALGIISNAQFFTLELFPALLDQTPALLGFHPDLQFYSYRYGRAKPDEFLYQQAVRKLAEQGISVDETIYVGNDMLNDIAPASRVGFRTALFAGDARSLRLRAGDDRVDGVVPDLVLPDLASLGQCLLQASRHCEGK